MIAFLEGKIIYKPVASLPVTVPQLRKTEKFIVLDVNGVGYKVFLSKKALTKIPEISETIKVFCFLNVRENALDLYGFLDLKELEFFEILDSIRGVGPKAALEISSLGPLEKIKERIISQDEKLFEGIPGIGRKKAMAIILELSGKIKDISKKSASVKDSADEAEEGLLSLGFSRQQAKIALAKVPKDIKNTEQRIKEALKILGK